MFKRRASECSNCFVYDDHTAGRGQSQLTLLLSMFIDTHYFVCFTAIYHTAQLFRSVFFFVLVIRTVKINFTRCSNSEIYSYQAKSIAEHKLVCSACRLKDQIPAGTLLQHPIIKISQQVIIAFSSYFFRNFFFQIINLLQRRFQWYPKLVYRISNWEAQICLKKNKTHPEHK